jgi:hypothetical protein
VPSAPLGDAAPDADGAADALLVAPASAVDEDDAQPVNVVDAEGAADALASDADTDAVASCVAPGDPEASDVRVDVGVGAVEADDENVGGVFDTKMRPE